MMLERRVIQIGTRYYKVKVKPAGHNRAGALSAVQILGDAGAAPEPQPTEFAAFSKRIRTSSNLSAHILTELLDQITKKEPEDGA